MMWTGVWKEALSWMPWTLYFLIRGMQGGPTVRCAMAAGIATLSILMKPGTYETLESSTASLAQGLAEVNGRLGAELAFNRVGSMFTTFFTPGPVTDFAGAKGSDTTKFGEYFRAMLDEGIYLAPSQFEAAFMSLAHSEEDIAATVAAHERALKKVL